MSKKKSQRKNTVIPMRKLVLLGAVLSLILYVFYFNFPYYIFLPHHNVVETKKNDLKEIPREVKAKHPLSNDKASYQIPILMYHYVEYVKDKNDTIRESLNTHPDVFEAQIKTLKDDGYDFLTMAEVADVLDGKKELPPKPVVLTFDDGYRDFYEVVFPILKKYNIKAVAYVVPGFFDRPNYMFTWQIRELAKYPNIELGAHTLHHVYLKEMPSLFAQREIRASKYALEDIIHKPVVSFAYPYGAFDNNAIELVKKANLRTAVSTIGGVVASEANRYFIFRVRPGYMTGIALSTFIDNPPFGP